MFTGLIEEIGAVQRIAPQSAGLELEIAAESVLEGLRIGDSIAVSGPCLTVVDTARDTFNVQAARETVERTTIASWRLGTPVNLERALAAGSRLGGHIVQGHIDGVGTVKSLARAELDTVITVQAPPEITRYIVIKGSVAVDGVSLTVAKVEGDSFTIAVIPHTLKATTLSRLRAGDKVNLETDILAKYVEKFIQSYRNTTGITENTLRNAGF